ncbi:MAG: electron transfer flavoprotein subunit beta/FixA family protein [Dysgonomonas sp.]
MKIIVCIKQVPASNKVEVDPLTGVLKRDSAESKLNPYDLYALETALRLREEYGGSVVVITMGPPQSEQIIKEAFAMGVDDGILLTDRRFGGADVLATSYALSQGITSIGEYDLILCGKQTTDGDTAQVGPEIAEWLNIPSISNVISIQGATDKYIQVTMDMINFVEHSQVRFPCLLAVDKDIYQPRLPSYILKQKTKDKVILRMTLDDMQDKDAKHYGLNGSPTQVVRIFSPENNIVREIWEGKTADVMTEDLFNILQSEKFI